MSKKLYAVTGRNGVAVMSDWSRAQRIMSYYVAPTCKGFPLYKEAEEYALEWLGEIAPFNAMIPAHLTINEPIWISHLERRDA